MEALPSGPRLFAIVSIKLFCHEPLPSGLGTRKRMSLVSPPPEDAEKVFVWHGYVSYLGLYPSTLYHLPSRSAGLKSAIAGGGVA